MAPPPAAVAGELLRRFSTFFKGSRVFGTPADRAAPDVGRADVGRADVGRADVGRADVGRADVARADVARADVGRADVARADVARADVARADVGRADVARADVARVDRPDDLVTRAVLADAPVFFEELLVNRPLGVTLSVAFLFFFAAIDLLPGPEVGPLPDAAELGIDRPLATLAGRMPGAFLGAS